MVNHLGIIGLGYIGSSIAKALKKANFCKSIVGFDTNSIQLNRAVQQKLVDNPKNDAATLAKNSDFIVIATPISEYENLFSEIVPELKNHTVLTDILSVKSSSLEIAQRVLKDLANNFVPSHPLLNLKHSSKTTIPDDLFAGQTIIVTPDRATNPDAVNLVKNFWSSLGSEIKVVDIAKHDQLIAASHQIPQILSFAFINQITKMDQNLLVNYVKNPVLEFTDLALAHETGNGNIIANKHAILQELNLFQENLKDFINLLQTNPEELSRKLEDTKNLRRALSENN